MLPVVSFSRNNDFYISAAIENADDADKPVCLIYQIKYNIIIYRHFAHSHRSPWLPPYFCITILHIIQCTNFTADASSLPAGCLAFFQMERNIGKDRPKIIQRLRRILHSELFVHIPNSCLSTASTSSAEIPFPV